MARFPVLILTMGLAACGGPAPKAASADNATDPALASALADPIMVDPQLGAQANTDTVRPPDMPLQATVPAGEDNGARDGEPVTLGARAREQANADRNAAFVGCDLAVSYSLRWSTALPAALKIPDAARVSEAAGSDAQSCHLRVVSYAIAADPDAALAHYRAIAAQAGFAVSENAEAGGKTLAARRKGDGAAFTASVSTGEDGGSVVDLMSNRGR